MKNKWLKWLILTSIVLVLISPLALCWWIAWGHNAFFKITLPTYPEAHEVSEAYGYYGSGAGSQTIYYWSPRSVDEVRSYYEAFTLPFRKSDDEPHVAGLSSYWVTFDPHGEPLPIITAEFGGEIINLATDGCYYKVKYRCVRIELVDFGEANQVVLRPPPVPMRIVRPPSPLSSNLKGGTLIIYRYFVEDIS